MIKKIIQNVWIFLFGYICFDVYQNYIAHNEKIDNIQMDIPSLENNIKQKQKKVKELEKYFSDIDSAKQRIERVAEEVEKIQKKFPSDINDSFYINGIKNFTKSLNLRNVEISSGGETDQGFYFTKKFELSARGTYLQFLILLERIEGFEKLLNISKVSFKEISEKQKGRFQLIDGYVSIEAYRHDPSHKVDRGIDVIEKGFKNGKNKKKNKNKKRRKKK